MRRLPLPAGSAALLAAAVLVATAGGLATRAMEDGSDAATTADSRAAHALRWLLRGRSWRRPPEAPPTPTVTPAGADGLTVRWSPPDMQVLEIEDYELQYRVRGAATFLDWDHQGSATTATVSGLSPATTYEVRIRAITAAGAGDWSAAAHGATPEPVPRFEEGSEATRAIDENAPPDTAVGAPVRATAPHAVEYTLAGEDAGAFAIEATYLK